MVILIIKGKHYNPKGEFISNGFVSQFSGVKSSLENLFVPEVLLPICLVVANKATDVSAKYLFVSLLKVAYGQCELKTCY